MKIFKILLAIIMLIGIFSLTMGYIQTSLNYTASYLENPIDLIIERQEKRINIAATSLSNNVINNAEINTNIILESESAFVSPESLNYYITSTNNYKFRTTLKITNNSNQIAENIKIEIPIMESNSIYQTTILINNDLPSSLVLEPYETYIGYIDYEIIVRTLSINDYNNPIVKQVEEYYNKHKGNGNCRILAQAFIAECLQNGIQAREVIGYTRPQRNHMTSGCLKGTRHSWAEFYIPDLGWMPVDLTFQYFIQFPYTSHVVESYADKNLKITYNGGSLEAEWFHEIL